MMNEPNSDSAVALARLNDLLAADNLSPLKLDMPALRRLVERTEDAPLFTHSYPFYFHMGTDDGGWGSDDLLTFAALLADGFWTAARLPTETLPQRLA